MGAESPKDMKASLNTGSTALMSNADIADRLASLAQLLSAEKANPYKVKAYQRAAVNIRGVAESLDEMVRSDEDLTQFPGIGLAIESAVREIVQTGTMRKLEELRKTANPTLADISRYPRLDPKRILRIYKKLGVASIDELRGRLEKGDVDRIFGARMAAHVRQGLTETHAMLLYHADLLSVSIEEFLLKIPVVKRVEAAGEFRRRIEVIEQLDFVVETEDFHETVARMQRYGGRTPLVTTGKDHATLALSSGILLRLQRASQQNWGFQMIACTGSGAHLKALVSATKPLRELKTAGFASERALYNRFGLFYVEPELRIGHDEIERALSHTLPRLVRASDIRGELHAHSISSDGVDSIEDMAEAARERGYEYIGISDHSQSLKIAGGVATEDLRSQIRYIDRLNEKLDGIRVLKSSEVDILADGSLDYPDDLLKELDYTVCSIHSRFALDKKAQTERILRAMDNRYFNILGHATGRLLLKRPGYEIDIERVINQARQNGCFFEINSSPDRLDLSAENARHAAAAGVMIAVSTDSHSAGELNLIRCGLDQARRAGLRKSQVLNTLPWHKLKRLFRR